MHSIIPKILLIFGLGLLFAPAPAWATDTTTLTLQPDHDWTVAIGDGLYGIQGWDSITFFCYGRRYQVVAIPFFFVVAAPCLAALFSGGFVLIRRRQIPQTPAG